MGFWNKRELGLTEKNFNEIWLYLLSLFIGVLIASYWFATFSTKQFFVFQGIVFDLVTSASVFVLFSGLTAFRRKPTITFLWLGLVFGLISMHVVTNWVFV